MKQIGWWILAAAPLFSWAQTQQIDPVIHGQFGYVHEMPLREPGTVGSVYLNDAWKKATVRLKKSARGVEVLADITIKLDLKANMFDVLMENKVKVLSGEKVRSFTWMNDIRQEPDLYLNCDVFKADDGKLVGFARVLNKDTTGLMLLEHNYLEMIKANYNVALNVGSRENKFVKRTQLYVLRDGKLVAVNKNSLLDNMADQAAAVNKFIKENKISLKSQSSMAAVVDYYNTLGG